MGSRTERWSLEHAYRQQPLFWSDKSQANRNPGPNQTKTAISVVSNVSNYTSPKQIEAMSIPGNWSLEIADNVSRNATLTLFQNGDTVFGKGGYQGGQQHTYGGSRWQYHGR